MTHVSLTVLEDQSIVMTIVMSAMTVVWIVVELCLVQVILNAQILVNQAVIIV